MTTQAKTSSQHSARLHSNDVSAKATSIIMDEHIVQLMALTLLGVLVPVGNAAGVTVTDSTNGLGKNAVCGLYTAAENVYAVAGLGISSDGGASFLPAPHLESAVAIRPVADATTSQGS